MCHNVDRWVKRGTEAPEFIHGERHNYYMTKLPGFALWLPPQVTLITSQR